MNRSITLAALGALATACAPATPPAASPQASESPTASASSYPTTPPALGPAPTLRLPSSTSRTLANGMTVVYVPKRDLPLVQAVVVTRGGLADDAAERAGLAAFTAEMLDEGAGGRDAMQLAEAVEQLGARLTTGASWDAAQVSMQVLRSRLPEALRLLADVAYRPDFPEREVTRIRDERLTELSRARDEARVVAGNAFAALLYGGDHPYGRLATTESVRRIDRAALVDFHGRYYRPGHATLLLVGDVDESLHAAVVEAFGGWSGGALPPATVPEAPASAASRIYLIDKPGAPQSEVRIGHPGVSRDNPDFFPLQVLNTILGGSFTSRLMQNLRETHGYTYGAGSSFAMRRGSGPFTASAAVVTAKTDSAVIEFFRELERIRDEPVGTEELERAKNYIALGLPQSFETSGQMAQRLSDLVVYGLPLDYYDTYVQRVMAVTAADVQRVAREYVRPGNSAVVVVGDLQAIEPGLRALPFGQLEVRPLDEFVR